MGAQGLQRVAGAQAGVAQLLPCCLCLSPSCLAPLPHSSPPRGCARVGEPPREKCAPLFGASPQVNGQGNDHGTQYRSGIYYHDDAQRDLAEAAKATLEAKGRKIAVEVAPAAVFWPAEGYHQQYLEKGGQDARKGATSSIRCYG